MLINLGELSWIEFLAWINAPQLRCWRFRGAEFGSWQEVSHSSTLFVQLEKLVTMRMPLEDTRD